jgi:hypothetical protein
MEHRQGLAGITDAGFADGAARSKMSLEFLQLLAIEGAKGVNFTLFTPMFVFVFH